MESIFEKELDLVQECINMMRNSEFVEKELDLLQEGGINMARNSELVEKNLDLIQENVNKIRNYSQLEKELLVQEIYADQDLYEEKKKIITKYWLKSMISPTRGIQLCPT